MFQELEGLELWAFCGGVFTNPDGTGGNAFEAGGVKLRFVLC